MQYVKFEIKNYRGITETQIELPSSDGARVTTLIGLNESGKTTILEAIYSFSPDEESKALYEQNVLLSQDSAYYIPRSQFSSFDGESTVEAFVSWSESERNAVIRKAKMSYGIEIDPQSLPLAFSIISGRKYVASRQVSTLHYWRIRPKIKTGKQKLFRDPISEERKNIISILLRCLPRIAYFPTFLFSFPERIYLKGGENAPIDKFYMSIFQSVLEKGGEGHKIKEHIVQRFEEMHNRTVAGEIIEAVSVGLGARSAREMIKQTVDKAADTVSYEVVSKWDEMFPHSPLRKEITIDCEENFDEDSGEHDIWLEFKVKDSGNRYNIADRSLGFRWFFCFLLFTKFMSKNSSDSGILFLFDEPASNLHAKAQEKLLESFSEISSAPNSLIFSTHSHYMVEPNWLGRAYIVKNDAIDYSDAAGEISKSRSVNIEAVKYKRFVSDKVDGKTTYFQPILDRLDVKPSQIEIYSKCIVVEGKSDFYILRYTMNNYMKSSIAIVPGMGATTMSPLIAIFKGWATDFVILLDSDGEGKKSRKRYEQDLDLSFELISLDDLLVGMIEIEDLFTAIDRQEIASFAGAASCSKKVILRAFQEACASGQKIKLERATIEKMKRLLSALNERLVPVVSSSPKQKKK